MSILRSHAHMSALMLGLLAAPAASGAVLTLQEAKLTASAGAAGDQFGVSVSISGDTAVVGAHQDDHAAGIDAGSACVLVRSGSQWTLQDELIAADADADDAFGISVSISGDTAVVGAYTDDHAAGADAGSAYVFVRSGAIWTEQAKLIASDAAAGDGFGASVSISGDTVVIGAYTDDHAGGADAGSAYVFVRSGTVWTEQGKLTASDAAASDLFGIAASVSADTAVVGAAFDDHAGGADAGSTYVFVRSGAVWTQQAKLTASDAAEFDNYGYSISINGETALVGALFDDHAGGASAGSAYVSVRSGAVWTEQAKLTASDAAAFDSFGSSVSISGDSALVGAIFDAHAGGNSAGSAYVFIRSGAVWTEQAKLTALDAAASDQFGNSVSMNADTAIIGAYVEDNSGGADAGSAYVFRRVVPLDECCLGDMDQSGGVDGNDIQGFVDKLLSGGACP